jgi:hypothetical protein
MNERKIIGMMEGRKKEELLIEKGKERKEGKIKNIFGKMN